MVMKMCVLTVHVTLLVVISCYSFVRCYHCGKLGKGYIRALFLQLDMNLQFSQK